MKTFVVTSARRYYVHTLVFESKATRLERLSLSTTSQILWNFLNIWGLNLCKSDLSEATETLS